MKHMRTTILLTAATLAMLGGLTGCGLKGDLYLPEEPTDAAQAEQPGDNAPAAAPEPDTAVETLPTP